MIFTDKAIVSVKLRGSLNSNGDREELSDYERSRFTGEVVGFISLIDGGSYGKGNSAYAVVLTDGGFLATWKLNECIPFTRSFVGDKEVERKE